MPEPTQTEPVVPAGSGDPAFDAALVEAASVETPAVEVPAAETPAVETPEPSNPDYTFSTLQNGEREVRLATGQVYRGKDDAEVMNKLVTAQLEASRHITQLNGRLKEVTPEPVAPTPSIDPTALAIADLMAPAFGVKNGQELVAAFAEQQRIATAQQEYMAAQTASMEAANFFRAVPEFSKSQADADKIDSFLNENKLPFNAKTAEMAYYTLKAKGEMTAPASVPRGTAPKNNMPPPPTGTAPANTGKGQPTEADLYSMTTEQLAELIGMGAEQ